MATTLAQLKAALAIHFPKMWVKGGAEFDNEHKDSLWTGEGSYVDFVVDGIEIDNIPVFDGYDEFGMHPNGILKKVRTYVESHGYYFEMYDAGTFFIYKD